MSRELDRIPPMTPTMMRAVSTALTAAMYPRRELRFPAYSAGEVRWWARDPTTIDDTPDGTAEARGTVVIEQGCRACLFANHHDATFLTTLPDRSLQGLSCRWDDDQFARCLAHDTGQPSLALIGLRWLRNRAEFLDVLEFKHLAPIRALTQLQSLNLAGTWVSNLAPIRALTQLQSLNLAGTRVSDLAPIHALTQLQLLNLQHTRVSDLAPIQALTQLESLDLYGTRVSDLAPLVTASSLQRLLLSAGSAIQIPPSLRDRVVCL